MTQQLSTTENSIELPSLKQAALERAPSRASSRRLWKKVGAWFWAFTEETGEADTTSFKGLL